MVVVPPDRASAKVVDVCYTENLNLLDHEDQEFTVSGYIWDSDRYSELLSVLGPATSLWMTAKVMPKTAKKLGCSLWVETRDERPLPKNCVYGAKVTVTGVFGYGTDIGLLDATVKCSK